MQAPKTHLVVYRVGGFVQRSMWLFQPNVYR